MLSLAFICLFFNVSSSPMNWFKPQPYKFGQQKSMLSNPFKKTIVYNQNVVVATSQSLGSLLSSSGLVFVWVSAPYCPPCKALEPLLLEAVSTVYSLVKLNIDDFEEADLIMDDLNIESFPTVIALKDGNEVARFTGLICKEKVKEFIEGVY